MNNFYKGGRGLAFSQREGEASFRKEKPPRLSKVLINQVEEEGTEGSPNSTRRNRWVFHRFFDVFKARIKYRCSKDVVPFTQRLRKIAEVPLMYRECTVSVRGVYRKGTGDLLRSYWRPTKDPLNACSSGVDQRYSNRRRIVGVEAMTSKSMPFALALICFSRRLFSLTALKNIRILCLGFLCFMLFNLSDAWAQSAESRTAEGQTEIQPLQIGRRVPEDFWTKEHLFFINGDTIRKTLEEHRGKMLVLDFWFSGCSPCLIHQKEIREFVSEYPDDLAVVMVNSIKTKEDYDTIKKRYQNGRFKQFGVDEVESIIEDEYLSALFPSTSYPHYIWINHLGLLQLRTYRNLLDKNYVAPFIEKP
ncbi:thioredoxin family protein [Sphingobacterium phlebotomi]|uniref:Thioredoxin family protein n=1 Tax=Sphingobacterium phlebotomi TaxID=2605433 RepID=A0A5D4H509_9SPHI|nr:thioredoxin family protein [Sphingobacterium phlebotomi]TYR35119.1 thioredoxin family protein [Sphingobacterium phlebotomi]